VVKFDADFEEEILAQCLADRDYLRTAARMLDRRHFSTPQAEWAWKTIRAAWVEHGELATAKLFKSRAGWDYGTKDDERALALKFAVKLLKRRPVVAKGALAELRKYTEFVALNDAMAQAAKRLEEHDIEGAVTPLREVIQEDFRPRSYTVVDWIEQFDARQAERKKKREEPDSHVCIPTGISQLDRVMDGLRVGEFGIVMGTTGRGKSIFLTHLGFHAIARGYRVVHLSLEMNAELVATRYDSRFTGLLHRAFKTYDFTAEDLEIIEKKVAIGKKRYKRKLRIISTPVRTCDINVVRGALEDARSELGGVDLVILDSPDHMKSLANYREVRHQQADVYWAVKDLAESDGVAVWGSTHAGREYADRVAGAEAAAESYDKARIADVVLTLNAPAAPKKKEAARASLVETDDGDRIEPAAGASDDATARPGLDLFLAKHRDGESKLKIPLATDLARMLIREAEREEAEAA